VERIPCEPTEGCKYFPDCFEDRHHPYQRALARTALEATFSDMQMIRTCRQRHEQLERELGWLEYPDRETMQEAVREAHEAGDLYLSRNKIKRIFGSNHGTS